MADRYVIPAGGNSNTTATWSATDGGAGGASIPVSGDTAYCTALSGNLAWVGTQSLDNVICTGYTGTMSGSGTPNILGDTYLLVPTMTYTATGTRTFTGANAVGDVTITSAGLTTSSISFNGVGKVFKIADALTIPSTSTVTVTNGTFLSQGFDITGGTLSANNTNTKTITLTGSDLLLGSTLIVDGTNTTWSAPDLVRFTRAATNPSTTFLNAGVALKKVEISRAVTGVFSGFSLNEIGGNLSIEFLEYVGVANANWLANVIVAQADITIDKCAFPEGTEIISSANGTQRTITTGTNEISFDGCMIRDIVISGGPAYATNSIDLGNNSGITFNNFGPATHEIVGETLDNDGVALPSCTVVAFKEDGGEYKEVSRTTSDGTTGAYTLPTPDNDPAYLIVGVKASPERGDAMGGITPTVP